MKPLFSLFFIFVFAMDLSAAEKSNTDETKVPSFTLPDPLTFENGTKVETAEQWPKRRLEILGLFEEHVYGSVPPEVNRENIRHEVRKTLPNFLEGKAEMQEVRIFFTAKPAPYMDLLIIWPKSAAEKPVPTFLTLNFAGNHTVHPSSEISIPETWVLKTKTHKASEEGRGEFASRWPIDKIIDAGCAIVTIQYGDIDPDFDDGFENGLHTVYGKPKSNEWGSIATWAHGLSIARDYLGTEKRVDQGRVAVFGHSRLGKTALWAGANDERFALVISNCSGCGGAALSRRRFGEKVARINRSFPHWFNDQFPTYDDRENDLPVDQHQLISLIAPRRVYIASAVDDTWADPKGEFLAGKHAEPVFTLLGKKGLGVNEQPAVDQPVGEGIRYHVRTGKHDVTDFDWEQYIAAIKSLP